MKKILSSLLFTMGILMICTVAAHASTSYTLDAYEAAQYLESIRGDWENVNPNFDKTGTEYVNADTGGLIYTETDLNLPGKSGLDLTLTRKYDSQIQTTCGPYKDEPAFQTQYVWFPQTNWDKDIYEFYYQSDCKQYIYTYHLDSDPSRKIYIAFENEMDLKEYGDNYAQHILLSSLSNSKNFTSKTKYEFLADYRITETSQQAQAILAQNQFYLAAHVISPTGTIACTREDVPAVPVWVTGEINNGPLMNNIQSVNTGFNLGYGWTIPVAGIYFKYWESDNLNGTQVQKNHYLFIDEEGKSYEVEYAVTYDSTTGKNVPVEEISPRIFTYQNDGSEKNTSKYTVEYIEIDNGLPIQIKDEKGVSWKFGGTGLLLEKADRFGNKITYQYDGLNIDKIIDSFGREINFTYDEYDILKKIDVEGETKVSYALSESFKSIIDQNENFKTNRNYYLTVTYGEQTDTTAQSSEYLMYLDQNTQKIRDYDETRTEWIYKLMFCRNGDANCREYDYIKPTVYFSEDKYTRQKLKVSQKNGIEGSVYYSYSNEKEGLKSDEIDDSDYTYTSTVTSGRGTTKNKFDKEHRLIEERVLAGNILTVNLNTYVRMNGSNVLDKQKIYEIMTENIDESLEDDYVAHSVSYYQDRAGNLTGAADGYKHSYYSTNLPYNLVDYMIEYQQKQSPNQYTKTVNTPTYDKKNIAKSQIYQGINDQETLMETIDYTYDSYGNVTSINRNAGGLGNESYAYQMLDIHDTVNNPDKYTMIVTKEVATGGGVEDINTGETAALITTYQYYDLFGRLVKEKDGNGTYFTYTYNDRGDMLSRKNETTGKITSYEYDYQNFTVIETDPNNNKTKYQYDPMGRFIKSFQYADGEWVLQEEVRYNGFTGYISYHKAPDQMYGTTYDFYPDGRIKEEKILDGDGNIAAQTTYQYEIIQDGHPDRPLYDNYEHFNTKVTINIKKNSTETTTYYRYFDLWGRLIKEETTDPATNTLVNQTYTYNAGNQLLKMKDFRTNQEFPTHEYTTKYEYDYAGRVVKEYNAQAKFIQTQYNVLGQPTAVTDYAGNTTTNAYNNLGMLLSTTTPMEEGVSSVRTYTYDRNGNLQEESYSTNKPGETATQSTIEYDYDTENRLIKYAGDDSGYTTYTYDAGGRLTQMYVRPTVEESNEADRRITTYEYNSLNQMVKETDALGKSTLYEYYDNGTVKKMTDRNGAVTNYTYNALGGLTNKNAATTYKSQELTQTYDMMGNRTSAQVVYNGVTESSSTYQYDALGRMTQEVTDGNTKAYIYDIAGNRKSFNLNNGEIAQTYAYNDLNQLVWTGDEDTAASYTYDDNGNLITQFRSNNVVTDYTYNQAGLITNMKHRLAGNNQVLMSYDYTYYLDGNQAGKTENGVTTNYTYDSARRLTQESKPDQTINYTYDAYGNRTQLNVTGTGAKTVTYSYDANNRLTSDATIENGQESSNSYFYTNNGALTYKIIWGNGEKWYSSDLFNQLRSDYVSTPSDANAINYTYTADGLRKSISKGDEVEEHVWDGTNLVKAGDTTYTRGLMLLSNSNGQFYMHNAHGDVVGLSDAQSNVIKTYTYDAFGVEQNIDPNDTNPFRYCGEYYDKETGDIYLRARYYRPSIGRFTQEDPAKDGLNWYVYCDSDPVNRIDITGLEWGYIRDFAKDLAMIFGGDPNYNFGYGGVRVTVGEEYYQKSGMFYFDGFVELQRNGGRSFTTQQVAQNNNGQLYMQRTDFYEAMNVKYVVDSQTFTITEFENNIPRLIADIIITGATKKINSYMAMGIGEVVDNVIKELQLEAGEYKVEYTIAEVYNGALDLYESITTTSYYRLGINSKGELTEQFVTSVTNYNGTFIESMV